MAATRCEVAVNIRTVATKAFTDQRPGTFGLRKKTRVFMGGTVLVCWKTRSPFDRLRACFGKLRTGSDRVPPRPVACETRWRGPSGRALPSARRQTRTVHSPVERVVQEGFRPLERGGGRSNAGGLHKGPRGIDV